MIICIKNKDNKTTKNDNIINNSIIKNIVTTGDSDNHGDDNDNNMKPKLNFIRTQTIQPLSKKIELVSTVVRKTTDIFVTTFTL